MKISIISGGFDPLHSGHISYIHEAKKLGDKLIVLLNSDEWLIKKKGKNFLPFKERALILESIKFVDEVLSFPDDKLGSCTLGLKLIKEKYPKDELIFCNGGDRNKQNIPEQEVKDIDLKFNIGGNFKKNSSSKILHNWKFEKEERIWGEFSEIFRAKDIKVKELVMKPKKEMSFQRHFHRSEVWFISEGKCKVRFTENEETGYETLTLSKEDTFQVKKQQWHQLINPYDDICKIIEIQYGNILEETDIQRLSKLPIKK